jgi:enamine deaminase RidA (YjgF/YER057c/UK114 family)
MARRLISTGSPFEETYAYSRAVVQGDWCFVAGTIGYDYDLGSVPETVEAQTDLALKTIRRVLADAGFDMANVVRTVIYLPEPADQPKIAHLLRDAFGTVRPANTTVAAPLLNPAWKIEIEVTAFRG